MPLSSSYYYPQVSVGSSNPGQNCIIVSNSASIIGNSYQILLAATDISKWNNFTVTLVNNGLTKLESGSVEISPNNSSWEVLNNNTFAGLAAGAVTSSQFSDKSYKWLRVRGIPSGSGGALTGSIDTYLIANSG